ncbi:hypothetical protein ACOJUY_004329 [Vibrio alginolyticus]|uniref:hypothetical protein n=1 Tax=Vibrio diabolicus TaxID=50719 RepID=UPI00193C9490|nr:hypothetical protein [Vibrio diabolicus]EGQ8547989.1 hypothetical protein [Vibrio parahaemolyticus]EHA1078684.1 hypothetical protein [Vibrio alginolyticus]EHA1137124.1 hypothetical protein [Vibrio alginolyticus]EJC6974810.1 hypothetical protein [Vibrio parahaemolyticus]EJC7127699.1 hypothetical protein [Vibrio parahaemolyticus]
MATITEELRLAIREFKSRINSLNFVINHEEPPYPIGSIASYKAQLEIANEYLRKYPKLNSETFNTIGLPLFVKNSVTRNIEIKQAVSQQQAYERVNELLWDAYLTLDHGTHDERLTMLAKLEKHFDSVGKPTTKS